MKKLLPLILLTLLSLPVLGQDPRNSEGILLTDFKWNQTTGLINIPIARVVKAGTVFGAFNFNGTSRKQDIFDIFSSEFIVDANGDQANGSFNFIFSPFDRFEVGIQGLHNAIRGEGNTNSLKQILHFPPAEFWSVGAKYLVKEEGKKSPAIAVGVENLRYPVGEPGREPDGFRSPGWYAVATKSYDLNPNLAINLHGGYGTGRFKDRPFAGAELAMANGLGFMGEYDGKLFNYGLRYTGLKNFRFTVGFSEGVPAMQMGYQFNLYDVIAGRDYKDYNPYHRPHGVPKKDRWEDEYPDPEDKGEDDWRAEEALKYDPKFEVAKSETKLPKNAGWKVQNPYLRRYDKVVPKVEVPKIEMPQVEAPKLKTSDWKLENPYIREYAGWKDAPTPKKRNSEPAKAAPASQDWKMQNPYLRDYMENGEG